MVLMLLVSKKVLIFLEACYGAPSWSKNSALHQNSKQIFPEMKLGGFVTNFCIHVHLAIYIFPRSVRLSCCLAFADPSREYINRSQIHACRNRERRRTFSSLGIFVWYFRYSAFVAQHLLVVFTIHSDILGKEEDAPQLGTETSPDQSWPCTWCRTRWSPYHLPDVLHADEGRLIIVHDHGPVLRSPVSL